MTVVPEAVFIGGCPRSGTTLLASLLGALPGCVVTPESQFKLSPLRRLQRNPASPLSGAELERQLRRHFRFRQWQVCLEPQDLPPQLEAADLRRLLLRLAQRCGERQGVSGPAVTWIDHTPQNIETGQALSRCFPSARLIHIVRDPRAVAASLLPLDWGPMAPAGVAALWSHRLAHGLALEQVLGERIRRVRYEDLCRDPEGMIGDLAGWLGLPLPATGAAPGSGRAAAEAGDGSGLRPVSDFLPAYTRHQHGLIGSPPRTDRIDAWRGQLQAWQQAELEERLGELMAMAGYLPDPMPAAGPRRPGPWRRQLQPLLRTLQGRLRHRWRQGNHSRNLN